MRISVSVLENRHVSPSKNISWKRVKKPSNPSRITGTASDGDGERREGADQQAERDDGAQSRPRERDGKHREREDDGRAAPLERDEERPDIRMCVSSRSSNAGEPSGSVARSRRTIPSEPGLIDRRPSSASASRCSSVSP